MKILLKTLETAALMYKPEPGELQVKISLPHHRIFKVTIPCQKKLI